MKSKTSNDSAKLVTDSPRRITEISIENYKSLGSEVKIKIAPLTILAGINSSGKSSFFQPLLLLKQTQEATFRPSGLLLSGPNIKINEVKSITSYSKGVKQDRTVKVGFHFSDEGYIKNFYGPIENQAFDIKATEFVTKDKKCKFHASSPDSQLRKLFDKSFIQFLSKKESNHVGFLVRKDNGFLDIGAKFLFKRKEKSNEKPKEHIVISGGQYRELMEAAKSFVNLLHIPGIRGNPERNYSMTATKSRYIGRFEDYTASIIYQWQHSANKEDKLKLKDLSKLLVRLGLTSKIKATKKSDVHIALEVGTLPGTVAKLPYINIADVGFGVSQVLPILVALIEAKKFQPVYIEQPELHLHPRAQSLLGEILAEYAKKSRTIIIETHSAIILRKIQTLIARKTISNEQVSFNWFSMNKNAMTNATSANLDEKGRYGDWPQDFDDTYLDVESEYIKYATR